MDETLEMVIATATPEKLIVMLYARAIKDLRSACELYDLTGDPRSQADAIRLILHAQQIIAELNNHVNEKDNAGLVENLKRFYEYIQYRLVEAISKRDKNPINEVIGLLVELHNTWETLVNAVEKSKGD